jgi:hypothetical protein
MRAPSKLMLCCDDDRQQRVGFCPTKRRYIPEDRSVRLVYCIQRNDTPLLSVGKGGAQPSARLLPSVGLHVCVL